jgi:5-deoxy-glucuronate isomerase
MMRDLLVRAEKFRDRIEDFGYEYLSFETRKLEAGQKYSSETGNRELAIVVLGGVCSVTSSRGEWLRFGQRACGLRPGVLLREGGGGVSGEAGDAKGCGH